jgi:hypothetical protein
LESWLGGLLAKEQDAGHRCFAREVLTHNSMIFFGGIFFRRVVHVSELTTEQPMTDQTTNTNVSSHRSPSRQSEKCIAARGVWCCGTVPQKLKQPLPDATNRAARIGQSRGGTAQEAEPELARPAPVPENCPTNVDPHHIDVK